MGRNMTRTSRVAQTSRQRFIVAMVVIRRGCYERGPFSKDQSRVIWHLEQ